MTRTVAAALEELTARVREAEVVVPVGARTHWEVGGPAPTGTEVRAPAGVVRHDAGDLTVTVLAGTTAAELQAALAEAGQECPLDPRHDEATVGGILACGLSGHRRLRVGPVRDRVLEVRFVTADGRLVKGGGPTVKNVSGYDLPRLLVGSLGTLGVLAQVTLRCQPVPPERVWASGPADPFELTGRLFRPSCVAWDGSRAHVLLEGHRTDVEAQLAAAGILVPGPAPALPEGPCRGRVSVPPGRLRDLAARLDTIGGLCWLAEVGVGTVHVAAAESAPVEEARAAARACDGWLLREAGPLEPFGVELPNLPLLRRLKEALDPAGKMNPGRLPL